MIHILYFIVLNYIHLPITPIFDLFKTMKNEIIIYQPDIQSKKIEVKVEDESVWLTQAQMVELFDSTKQNISLHINNIFKENELDYFSTVKEYLTVQKEGIRKVKRRLCYYNLDVIISVGYRVKSKRGTQFRIWANKVLKEFLLKGYVINNRIESIESDVFVIKKEIGEIKLQINSNLTPKYGLFYEGEIFDSYIFIVNLIKTAKSSLILIDNYIDESVLVLFSKREKNVEASIFTKQITEQFKLDLYKHNQQYQPIKVNIFTKSHDRFLIIDNNMVFHIGASLKDLGKKWFAFSKMEIEANEIISRLKFLN